MHPCLRILIPVLFLAGNVCNAQQQSINTLRVLEWNVENLFDTRHDEGKEDEDFTPEGDYHWTRQRYWQKLNNVAKVIAATSEPDGFPPDLIGLCEVENDSVLTDLTQRSALRNLYYQYLITESPDRRGIDVALLWQPGRFRPLMHQVLRVPSAENGLPPTRDMLYVKGLTKNVRRDADTLHVFVVHFPSQVSGIIGRRNRALAAATLWHAVDSILRTPSARIIVMGDFNATASDEIFHTTKLTIADPRTGGTYCFRGQWDYIDHILLSPSLSGAPRHVEACAYPWLLEENQTMGGHQPRRTFRGPSYHGGVSDHLPLLMCIEQP